MNWKMKLDRQLVIRVAPPSQVRDFLKKTEPSQRVLDEATEEFRLDVIREEEAAGEGLSLENLVEEREVSPMIRLVDSIIFAGLERRASDIHIESRDNSVVVKFRVDGVLAAGHGAPGAGVPVQPHHAHQGDVGTGHRRAPRSPGRPFPRALPWPSDRFSRLHHALDPRRRCGAAHFG